MRPIVECACVLIALLEVVCSSKADAKPGNGLEEILDPVATFITGPGLSANATLPVRHFYIHPRSAAGSSLPPDPQVVNLFRILIRGVEQTCRTWVQQHFTVDGTVLVVIRLLQCCPTTLEVEITALDEAGTRQQVADSPYRLPAAASLTELADCPASYSTWKKVSSLAEKHAMTCATSNPAIESNFAPFEQKPARDFRMAEMLHEAEERFARHELSYSFCFYRIKKNSLYRKCYGQHVGFNTFADATLLSVLRKVQLPDVDFLVNLGDYPLAQAVKPPLPILSWCGSNDTHDIIWPTYLLMESILGSIIRSSDSLDPLSLQRLSGDEWSKRRNQSIWRGRDSRPERLRLVELSRLHPEHINAAMTNFFFYRDKMKTHGPLAEHMPFDEFFKFKYVINVDGTVAAYRMPFLLAGGSVVFKQDSPYYEHFYPFLEPWKHYIPVKRDLSDLTEQIDWARNNDDAARVIAQNGVQLVQKQLGPDHLLCYVVEVLVRLSTISNVHPSSIEELGLEYIKQPLNSYGCRCPSEKTHAVGHEEL